MDSGDIKIIDFDFFTEIREAPIELLGLSKSLKYDRIILKIYFYKGFIMIVTQCEKIENHYRIILDETPFFPEGGGQKGDDGTINGIKVSDVQKIDGKIVHFTEEPINVGAEAECDVDLEKRFDKAQNHTGEHIVCGIAHNLYGYENVGFHLDNEKVTFDLSGKLTDDEMKKLELLANKVVWQNKRIIIHNPTPEELPNFTYRSKLELTEDVRIVEIEGVDFCACCAPHVERTGEVGVIKFLNWFPHRGGMRIEMVCGERAFRDYDALHGMNAMIMKELSASRTETASKVHEICEINGALKAELSQLRREKALSEMTVQETEKAAFTFAEGADYELLRECINKMKECTGKICFAFSENDDGVIYTIYSGERDIMPVARAFNAEFSGRGGGRDGFAQGRVNVSKEILVAKSDKFVV